MNARTLVSACRQLHCYNVLFVRYIKANVDTSDTLIGSSAVVMMRYVNTVLMSERCASSAKVSV